MDGAKAYPSHVLILFWIAVGLIAWVYAGYPLAAWVAARLRPFRPTPAGPGPAVVTIGIAAHNEARQLEARIANVLAQEVSFELEVIVASDGSTDASVALVERLASEDPRIRLLELERSGQTAAQRAIFGAARGEIVVLTDAETRFAPGCLAALVAPFADPAGRCRHGPARVARRGSHRDLPKRRAPTGATSNGFAASRVTPAG